MGFGVVVVVFLQKPWSALSPNSYGDSSASLLTKDGIKEFLHLKGQFRSFDPTRRTLEITCSGLLLDVVGNDLHLGATLEARRNITIYTDVQTEIDTISQKQEKLAYTPTNVIPPIPAPAGLIGNQEFSTFNVNVTVIPLRSFGFLTAEFLYPWDEWVGRKVFVAANDSGSGVVPLYGLQTDVTSMDYLMATHSHSNCFDPNAERCELSVTFVMSRHYFVMACAVAVVIFNWVITSSLVSTACSMGTSPTSKTLILCVGAFFAVLELRRLLPVKILFANLIDLIGVIPNVILLYWCGVSFAVRTIRWNTHVGNLVPRQLLLPTRTPTPPKPVITGRTQASPPADETRIRPKKEVYADVAIVQLDSTQSTEPFEPCPATNSTVTGQTNDSDTLQYQTPRGPDLFNEIPLTPCSETTGQHPSFSTSHQPLTDNIHSRQPSPARLTYPEISVTNSPYTVYQDPGQSSPSNFANFAGNFYGYDPPQGFHRRPHDSRQPPPYGA